MSLYKTNDQLPNTTLWVLQPFFIASNTVFECLRIVHSEDFTRKTVIHDSYK